MADDKWAALIRERDGLSFRSIVGTLDDAGERRMVELNQAIGKAKLKGEVGDEPTEKEKMAAKLNADLGLRKRFDALYVDAMIAHRWFAKHFGEIMNGRDFAVKIPMADAGLSEVTKDRDAFAARVAELERKLEKSQQIYDCNTKQITGFGAEVQRHEEEMADIKAENAKLQKALEEIRGLGKGTIPRSGLWVDSTECGIADAALSSAPVTKPTRNSEKLASFVKYCEEHPEERFWQALRNWSGYWAVLVVERPSEEPHPEFWHGGPPFVFLGTKETFNIE